IDALHALDEIRTNPLSLGELEGDHPGQRPGEERRVAQVLRVLHTGPRMAGRPREVAGRPAEYVRREDLELQVVARFRHGLEQQLVAWNEAFLSPSDLAKPIESSGSLRALWQGPDQFLEEFASA